MLNGCLHPKKEMLHHEDPRSLRRTTWSRVPNILSTKTAFRQGRAVFFPFVKVPHAEMRIKLPCFTVVHGRRPGSWCLKIHFTIAWAVFDSDDFRLRPSENGVNSKIELCLGYTVWGSNSKNNLSKKNMPAKGAYANLRASTGG